EDPPGLGARQRQCGGQVRGRARGVQHGPADDQGRGSGVAFGRQGHVGNTGGPAGALVRQTESGHGDSSRGFATRRSFPTNLTGPGSYSTETESFRPVAVPLRSGTAQERASPP